MKVLITGKGSYIGEHIKSHLESCGYEADEADTMGDEWKSLDYSRYDSVVHVAAIVHDDAKSASEDLFRKVNIELPAAIAKLAKASGVKQFVFLSTMGVYGKEKTLSVKESIIDENTPLNANSGYGCSKLEAEKRLAELEDESFRIAIVRPPNVYGPGCKGNYIPLFKKLALKLFLCPYVFTDIQQSMLYIDNLSELIKLIIENHAGGTYMPQDDKAPDAVEIIRIIRDIYGKKTRCSKLLGALVKLFKKNSIVIKLYGGIRYDKGLSDCFEDRYQIVSFDKGMKSTYTI